MGRLMKDNSKTGIEMVLEVIKIEMESWFTKGIGKWMFS